MLRLLATLCLVASPLVGPAAPAVAAPKPGHKVGIDILNVTGSGCRPPTVTVVMSPDNLAFTVVFSEYQAYVGFGAKKKDAQKDCRIKLRVNPVVGFSFSIAAIDHRGYANLAAGATASQVAGYSFEDSAEAPNRIHAFAGPFDDNWQTTDITDSGSLGPCGAARKFNINSQLQVAAGSSNPASTTSLISMDSTDGSLTTTYHLSWRSC
jgi:hypothetical protein